MHWHKVVSLSFLFFSVFNSINSLAYEYDAPKAAVAPVIDGNGSDACWTSAYWYNMNQTWIGSAPTPADFSGRFKVSWDKNKIYLLAEITDDVLNDSHTDPLDRYYDDDALEILLDENKSLGGHEKSYNAFAYHVSSLLDVVDVDVSGNAKLFNDHMEVKYFKSGNVYIWECAINIYTDQFKYGALANPVVELVAGKKLGFSLAYCDNDGGPSRENFFGSDEVPLADKNVAYLTADYFGTITLVEKALPPTITFSQINIASGLANPTVMVCAPDGRIFVCEQEGTLRIIKNDVLLPSPVLKVNTTPVGDYSERGLIGFAIDPNYEINNFIYVYYTTLDNGIHNRVSRFTLNGDFVLPGSEFILLDLDSLGTSVSHNGGAMGFGADGKLYIATGDNQIPVEPRVSQDLTKTHGKFLRINSDGTIPADNPYFTGIGRSNLVWSTGLRNPFTFDIHPSTGKIFVNDVGEVNFEEINNATLPGKNFGWPAAEGFSDIAGFANPEYTYNHNLLPNDTTGCAITGGVFFEPVKTNYPTSLIGNYFFMDFCNNWINYIDFKQGNKRKIFMTNTYGGPVAIDMGIDGNLYYLSRTTSAVYKVVASDSPYPVISAKQDSIYTYQTQPTILKVNVSGKGPFTYQWKKNGNNIAGATTVTLTLKNTLPDDAGSYTVAVSNTEGTVESKATVLFVGPINAKPRANILTPLTGSAYSGGDIIKFQGSANDAEDGELTEKAYTWYLDFHHDSHIHDGVPVGNIKNGSFSVPTTGETSDNVYFTIRLIVKDNNGLTDTATVVVLPKKSKLSFVTQPIGLKVLLDGQPKITPFSTLSVQGVTRSIGPFKEQVLNGKVYVFDHWQHTLASDLNFTTPSHDLSLTAVYRVVKKDTTYIKALHDAYIQDGTLYASDAKVTYGSVNSSEIITKTFKEGPNRHAYIKFDISKFNDSIKTAQLKIFGNIETGTISPIVIPVGVYAISDTSWVENTISWTTKPVSVLAPLDTFNISSSAGNYYFIDVATYVREAKKQGKKFISLVLVNPVPHFPKVIFHSKENISGKGPQLVLTTDSLITVNFSSFSATPNGNEVNISWTASNEQANKSFVVMRTLVEGGNFEKIGEVISKSLSDETKYTFTDIQPVRGFNYYQIIILDKQGYEKYSNTLTVISNTTDIIDFMNNENIFSFLNDLETKYPNSLVMDFSDLLGKEIYRGPYQMDRFKSDIPNVKNGLYFLKVYSHNQLIFIKKILLNFDK